MMDAPVGLHQMAPAHLPSFIPGADGSDGMFGTMSILIVFGAFVAGAVYFFFFFLQVVMVGGLWCA